MPHRQKRTFTTALSQGVIDRLDRWIEGQELPPNKTDVLELALIEFLDRREKAAAPPNLVFPPGIR